VVYVVVIHSSRLSEFHANLRSDLIPAWGRFTIVENSLRDCLVDQVNAGFAATSPQTKLLMGIMDDSTSPQSWDNLVLGSVPDVDEACVVQYATGSARNADLIVSGAVTRKRYEDVGYALYSTFAKAQWDDIYSNENSRANLEHGLKTYRRREAAGFHDDV
jgi:hypothetical protein